MKHVTFYHKDTGMLNPLSVMVTDDDAVRLNTPADHIPIDHPVGGQLDHRSQRVDIASGNVVEYQPPRPSDDHEWNANTRRWELSEDAASREAARSSALKQIRSLEASQDRAVREALIGRGGLDRLRDIDSQISELRKQL